MLPMRGSIAVICLQWQMTGCDALGRCGDRLRLVEYGRGAFKLLNRGHTSRDQSHNPGGRHQLVSPHTMIRF
jgi:hypothetical protein